MKLLRATILAVLTYILQAAAWGPHDEQHHGWSGRPGGYGHPKCHDASFVPDHVLRLTYENVSIGCQTRPSALVNGSIPGPELRLRPGKTSWIRVYNDMTDYNATIVSLIHWGQWQQCGLTAASTGTASVNALQSSPMARPQRLNGPLLL